MSHQLSGHLLAQSRWGIQSTIKPWKYMNLIIQVDFSRSDTPQTEHKMQREPSRGWEATVGWRQSRVYPGDSWKGDGRGHQELLPLNYPIWWQGGRAQRAWATFQDLLWLCHFFLHMTQFPAVWYMWVSKRFWWRMELYRSLHLAFSSKKRRFCRSHISEHKKLFRLELVLNSRVLTVTLSKWLFLPMHSTSLPAVSVGPQTCFILFHGKYLTQSH